jgi:transcriptional regulator with XRE-family HTH domain
MFNTMNIGKKIASLRKENNLTQMELADIMGVSYQAVSNWERGNSMPDISKLSELTTALGVRIDQLLEDEKPLNLVKHVMTGSEKEYVKDEKVTAETIAEVAPILKPNQMMGLLDSIIDNNFDKVSIHDLVSLAPFLDETYLDSLIEKVEESISLHEITALCPFLSKEAVDQLAQRASKSNIRELTCIAPFMSRETIDQLAEEVDLANIKDLIPLAPFISKDKLSDLAMKVSSTDDINSLTGLAPFLSKEALNKLAEEIIKNHGVGSLKSIAPFL